MLRDDYQGAFDADLTLASFSRQVLADLGREFLLNGHLQDRVGLPRVLMRHGMDALTQVSIDEWMGASPLYSKRMQRALGFEGNDVETIFKNLQFDIGAPHQFMEFRFDLNGPKEGEFWLECCGPLLDVEPFGEERVKLMCHDVEDPTFDATAAATHPCAKIRPIHRPPRVPSERVPHCRWRVFIDEDSQAYEQHPNLPRIGASKIAQLSLRISEKEEPGGWRNYSGPFDPECQLEDFSHAALVTANLEFCVQSHLLARSFLLCVGQRFGDEGVGEIATEQWTGIAGLTAERLKAALAIEGEDATAIAKVFQVHPCFHPRDYVDLRVRVEQDEVRIGFGPSPAFEEGDPYSWFAHLGTSPHPALDSIARAVNPRASAIPSDPVPGEKLAFRIAIDSAAEPHPEASDVKLAKVSKGARIALKRRRPLRT